MRATAEGTLLALGPLATLRALANSTPLLKCATGCASMLGVGTTTRGGSGLLK